MNVTPVPIKVVKKDCLTIQLNQHVFLFLKQKLGNDNIPVFLNILFETLKGNGKFLEMEGIFRKSGSIEEEEDIIMQLTEM